MEGLEISVVNLSYVRLNDVFRNDSIYFLKQFLREERIIRDLKFNTLKNLNVEIKSFGAYSLNNDVEYVEKGIPFIRGVNMKNGRIQFDDMIFITEKANQLLWKSEVKPEMILLSMSGTIGEVAIASKNWKYPVNSNQDIAKIDTNGFINPYYLYTFLMSKFGQNYLKREARGSVQQHVFLSQMENFAIPVISDEIVKTIETTIKLSEEKIIFSETKYSQAEALLLETLNLKDFKPSTEKVNVKSFKDSFLTTGRLDAEYYQKKYEDYLKLVQTYKNNYEPLEKACLLKDANLNPDEKQEYKYIELADIGKSGDINSCTFAYGNELPSRARRKVNTDDVIISSIEGSLGSCALVTKEYDEALCSTGFYIINSKKINSETLLVLFKSELMQNILKQGCSGTILTAINKNEFLKIPIPIIETKTQQQISELIEESFRLKKESEELLELAKRMVEVAIEEGEEKAMGMMKGNRKIV